MSTQNDTTFATETLVYEEFQHSQEHISRNLREEITQEISVFLEKITKLEETICIYIIYIYSYFIYLLILILLLFSFFMKRCFFL